MSHSPIIEVNELCFAYGPMEVLHNVNLKIEAGSYTVMVGPNGGGKTTLLRLILGLLQPMFGSISILGEPPNRARRFISYVPQSLQYDAQFPISVLEVVLMGRVDRHLFGNYTAEDKAIARKALQQVNLETYEKRPFSALSGGERQRTLIAQALAATPQIMLLDEPGASLDPENRLQLYELLHKLQQENQLTILLVSHNLNVVASYASHIICVNRTVDMHLIEEVRTEALETGSWTHLVHKNCPVGNQELAASHTPHLAEHPQCAHCNHSHCHLHE